MRRNIMLTLAVLFAIHTCLLADTLVMRDGRKMSGTFLGGNSREVHFLTQSGEMKTFSLTQVEAIHFGDQAAAVSREVLIPRGTAIFVRMVDPVNSDRDKPGDTFHALTDRPVTVENREIIPEGADVLVELFRVEQSGQLRGREEIALRLHTLRIQGVAYRVDSETAELASESKGGQSAKVIGGTAAVGAIIGAIAGGKKGAAIGAGTGAAAGTTVQVLRGKKVEVAAETLLAFRLERPVQR